MVHLNRQVLDSDGRRRSLGRLVVVGVAELLKRWEGGFSTSGAVAAATTTTIWICWGSSSGSGVLLQLVHGPLKEHA
jgi:hypothetical protein